MRQKSFLYSLMTLLTVSLSLSLGNQAHSNNIQSGDNPVIIIIRPSGSSSDTRPRMPSSTRIEAYYSPDTSTVYCDLANAGESVEVILSNQDTGETFIYEIPGAGTSFFLISGTSGEWVISFTLQNGLVYEGSFTL